METTNILHLIGIIGLFLVVTVYLILLNKFNNEFRAFDFRFMIDRIRSLEEQANKLETTIRKIENAEQQDVIIDVTSSQGKSFSFKIIFDQQFISNDIRNHNFKNEIVYQAKKYLDANLDSAIERICNKTTDDGYIPDKIRCDCIVFYPQSPQRVDRGSKWGYLIFDYWSFTVRFKLA